MESNNSFLISKKLNNVLYSLSQIYNNPFTEYQHLKAQNSNHLHLDNLDNNYFNLRNHNSSSSNESTIVLGVNNLDSIVKIYKDIPLNYVIIMFGYIMPVLIVITILFNSMIVIVLSQKSLRSPTNMVLLSMAIFDMLTLLFPAPWYFYAYTLGHYHELPHPKLSCYLFHCMNEIIPAFFHTTSIWLTLLLAGQRYICVCHPIIARDWCTIAKVEKSLFLVPFLAFAHQFSRFFDRSFLDVVYRNPNGELFPACFFKTANWVDEFIGENIYFTVYYSFRIIFVHLIPCTALVILNLLLFRTLNLARRNRKRLFNRNEISKKEEIKEEIKEEFSIKKLLLKTKKSIIDKKDNKNNDKNDDKNDDKSNESIQNLKNKITTSVSIELPENCFQESKKNILNEKNQNLSSNSLNKETLNTEKLLAHKVILFDQPINENFLSLNECENTSNLTSKENSEIDLNKLKNNDKNEEFLDEQKNYSETKNNFKDSITFINNTFNLETNVLNDNHKIDSLKDNKLINDKIYHQKNENNTSTNLIDSKKTSNVLALNNLQEPKSIFKNLPCKKPATTLEGKKQRDTHCTTLMLIVVVSVFLATEIPLAITTILHVTQNALGIYIANYKTLNSTILFTNFFLMLSYPVNFAIYCGMSRQFRLTFKKLFYKQIFCKEINIGRFTSNNTNTTYTNTEFTRQNLRQNSVTNQLINVTKQTKKQTNKRNIFNQNIKNTNEETRHKVIFNKLESDEYFSKCDKNNNDEVIFLNKSNKFVKSDILEKEKFKNQANLESQYIETNL